VKPSILKGMAESSKLLIFNIETDSESKVLSANIDMIAELSKYFTSVEVYSTYVGNFSLPKNVNVIATGGGSLNGKIVAGTRLLFLGLKIFTLRRPPSVLFHMNIKAAAVLAPILKVRRIQTTLWYSHASSTLLLRWCNFWINNIVTTSKTAYPLKHPRIMSIGQAVDSAKFPYSFASKVELSKATSFLHIGRITSVKYIEDLVRALEKLRLPNTKLVLIGDASNGKDKAYLENLATLCVQANIKLECRGTVKREELHKYLAQADFCFSGTKKAIDKSAIEAAFCGTLVVSTNGDLLNLLGLNAIYESAISQQTPSLEIQISFLSTQNNKSLGEIRSKVRQSAIENCDIKTQIAAIVTTLKSIQ